MKNSSSCVKPRTSATFLRNPAADPHCFYAYRHFLVIVKDENKIVQNVL